MGYVRIVGLVLLVSGLAVGQAVSVQATEARIGDWSVAQKPSCDVAHPRIRVVAHASAAGQTFKVGYRAYGSSRIVWTASGQPAGTLRVTLPWQGQGTTRRYYGFIDRSGDGKGAERSEQLFKFYRNGGNVCHMEPGFAQWYGAGAETANQVCAAGTKRVRTWSLTGYSHHVEDGDGLSIHYTDGSLELSRPIRKTKMLVQFVDPANAKDVVTGEYSYQTEVFVMRYLDAAWPKLSVSTTCVPIG